MPKVISRRLEAAIKKADRANALAAKLKGEAVSIFLNEQPAQELRRVISVIANSEDSFSSKTAAQMLNKLNTDDVCYETVTQVAKLVESNYNVLINSPLQKTQKGE